MDSLKIEKFEGSELIIREGEAVKQLPILAPLKLDICGVIESPAVFIEKRKSEFEPLCAHVIVNRDKGTIILITEEKNAYDVEKIKGEIKINPEFEKFKINTGHQYSPFELADFVKMNRSYFGLDLAKSLVETLRNFKSKIDNVIEKYKDDKAQFTLSRKQTFESNLPNDFNISVPIFVGQGKQNINVEIIINPENYACSLISPDVNDIIASYKDKIFDEVKGRIVDAAPDILIIEQ